MGFASCGPRRAVKDARQRPEAVLVPDTGFDFYKAPAQYARMHPAYELAEPPRRRVEREGYADSLVNKRRKIAEGSTTLGVVQDVVSPAE
jgi:hypothetical protein